MKIQNFKFTTKNGNTFIIDGEIDLFNNTGFGFTKLEKINGKKEDNLTIRQMIKHEDILNHIKNNQICQS